MGNGGHLRRTSSGRRLAMGSLDADHRPYGNGDRSFALCEILHFRRTGAAGGGRMAFPERHGGLHVRRLPVFAGSIG
ncbi:hypothetical protein D3C71_2133210 [compost metagenome]